ncbi:MAG: hypothetical protein K8S99_07965 [Planctomycetes bacterium]|nr:hypothetical protein [Planctomycetota bacterium]
MMGDKTPADKPDTAAAKSDAAKKTAKAGEGKAEPMDPEVARLTRQSEEQARRVTEAMDRSPADRDASAAAPTPAAAPTLKPTPKPTQAKPVAVKWIESSTSTAATPVPNTTKTQPTASAASNPATPNHAAAPTKSVGVTPVRTAANVPSASLTRTDLLQRLAEDIRTGDDPQAVKTTRLAALSLFDPSLKPSSEDIAKLDATQRARIERLQKALAVVAERLAAGDPFMQPDQVSEEFRKALGEQPLRIRNMQLCRRVKGFGIYEAFDDAAFLAGREQPVIVYVELENFHSEKMDGGEYAVSLSQELTLYNESDGLAVWQEAPVEVVDRSRNERRDFFVVQLVKLPARLTVGKFRLKVRMTDKKGGSMDETSIPLRIVADPSMVSK